MVVEEMEVEMMRVREFEQIKECFVALGCTYTMRWHTVDGVKEQINIFENSLCKITILKRAGNFCKPEFVRKAAAGAIASEVKE